MKRIFYITFVHIMVLTAHAQQKPHYTQYIINQYIINPALSGIENYTDIRLSTRKQWTGINGAPTTSYFTLNTPIGKDDYRTNALSYSVPGENPRGSAYWENYTAPAPHHGVGFQLVNDKYGAISNLSAYLTYAYHLGISARTSLAAGFGIGVSRYGLDYSKLDLATTVDPLVYSSGIINKTSLDFNAGLYLYNPNYFVGFSAQQINASSLYFNDSASTLSTGKTIPHLFLTAGYRFLLTEEINFIPSIMLKYIQPLSPQVEANLKFQYLDAFWVGASYRHKESFAGMMGFTLTKNINFSYSYDRNTSSLVYYNRGSHEITLGFILGNKYDDSCPRNVW